MIRGKDGRGDAPEQEKRYEAVDDIKRERPPARYKHQRDDERSHVQNELLRHEVPIELEHLVRKRCNYGRNHSCLYCQPDQSIRHAGNMLRSASG
jgi:hypothetical protein